MRRLLGLLVLAACAEAGKSGGHGTSDASIKLDAGLPGDATKLDAPSAVCTSNSSCAAGTSLGNVSGDTGADMVTASGYQAAWYTVRVSEDDSGPFGVKLRVTAQLISPALENYDVFLYVNSNTDTTECATPSGTASTSGTTDTLSIQWGEGGTFSNGSDDGRTVSIEIRPIGTTCSAGSPWQLTVRGD
ncbi:MAG: hypothetical protein ABI591_23500 [Kofleriaceae bacterium]